MNQRDRQTLIIKALLEGASTAAELAGEYEVSERTLYRDTRDIGRAGVPIVGAPGVGYHIDLDAEMPLALDLCDLLGLIAALLGGLDAGRRGLVLDRILAAIPQPLARALRAYTPTELAELPGRIEIRARASVPTATASPPRRSLLGPDRNCPLPALIVAEAGR